MAATLHGFWGKEKTVLLGTLVVSGGATLAASFGGPVAVKRLILVTTVALTTDDGKLIVGVRDATGDGSSTDHSAYTLPQSGSAANDVGEILLAVPDTAGSTAVDGLTTHAATPVLLEVASYQEIHITADSVPGAGTVVIYAQVQELGWQTGAANTGTSVRLVREAV